MKIAQRFVWLAAFATFFYFALPALAIVVVSQVQIAGISATDEYIELHNCSNSSVSLAGWSLKKQTASGSESNLVSTLPASAVIAPYSYYLVASHDYQPINNVAADFFYTSASISLAANNSVLLYSGAGEIANRVDWGSVTPPSGSPATNPPAGESIARLPNNDAGNCTNTDDSSADFILNTSAPRNSLSPSRPSYTPPPDAVPPATSTSNTDTTTTYTVTADNLWEYVKLNEIAPYPESGAEWVELYNTTSTPIDLTGTILCDGRSSSCTIATLSGTVGANSALAINISGSWLNNSGDTVFFKNVSGTILDSFDYSTLVPGKGEAVARDVDGTGVWKITTTLTPSANNIITTPAVPIATGGYSGGASAAATVSSVAKLTAQPTTTLLWNILPPPFCLAGAPAVFDAHLSGDPRGGSVFYHWNFGDKAELDGAVVEHTFASSGIFTVAVTGTSTQGTFGEKKLTLTVMGRSTSTFLSAVRVSSFLPHPGDKNDEFIRLTNFGTSSVALGGFELLADDKQFTIPANTSLLPGSSLTFAYPITHLSLSDVAGTILFRTPNSELLDLVSYSAPQLNKTYTLTNGEWSTGEPQNEEVAAPAVLGVKITASKISTTALRIEATPRTLPLGTYTTVRGTVVSTPDMFGDHLFYIQNEAGGIQIYSYKKEFPPLALGQMVTVRGTVSALNGTPRLRINGTAAIQLASEVNQINPTVKPVDSIDENDFGTLVTLEGDITKRGSNYLYLDDGIAEALVSIRAAANIILKDYAIGDHVAITGIVDETKSGWRLYPRRSDDIAHIARDAEPTNAASDSTVQSPMVRYLLLSGGGFGLVGVALFLKKKKTGS